MPVVVGRGVRRVSLDADTQAQRDDEIIMRAAASFETGVAGIADADLIVGQLTSKDAGLIAA